jgi:DNA-binding MarR family transcriptional regulator
MTTTDQPRLGRLLAHVCRLHHTRADQLMDHLGLFRGQAFLLMNLSEQDNMTHSEIAERLKISPAAATKVIKRMEQEGYVERRTDASDERVSRVYLCDKGRALITQIHEAFGELERVLLEGLSEVEIQQMRTTLTRMQANLDQTRVVEPDPVAVPSA